MEDSFYYKRTIVKELIESSILGENRTVRISLPPGYQEVISYPVIYCQDGEQFINFGRIATHMNRLVYDEGVEAAIIVCVDTITAVRTSEYAPEGERFDAYCRFFVQELLPFVERHYPVRASRSERILAGDSLGGTVSLHLALDYRSLFGKVISLSGAFLQATQERIAKEADLSWLELYMLIGLDEQEVTTERGAFDFLEANRRTRELLEQRNCKLTYLEKPGKHLWGFWQQELPAAMKLFL